MWKLPISILLGIAVAGKVIFFFLCWQIWRTYRRGFDAVPSQMVGLSGRALTDIKREGRVMVQGEYWWARARLPIAAGENVRVTGVDGMLLEVEHRPDKSAIPRPVSALISQETNIQ
jgi:membrane-bound serine protease (ClpP class)